MPTANRNLIDSARRHIDATAAVVALATVHASFATALYRVAPLRFAAQHGFG